MSELPAGMVLERAETESDAPAAGLPQGMVLERDAKADRQEVDTFGRLVTAAGQGAVKGVSTLIGMPVDLLNSALSLVPGFKASDAPLGGRKTLEDFINSGFGIEIPFTRSIEDPRQPGIQPFALPSIQPGSVGERITERVGEEVGFAAVPGAGLLAKGAQLGTKAAGGIMAPILETARRSPGAFAAGELTAAAGGGVAAGVSKEVLPENRLAEFGAQALGGFGATITPDLFRFGAKAVRGAISPFTENAIKAEVAEAVRRAATDPEAAARAATDLPDIPGLAVTAGQATGDPGLLALERSLLRKDAELSGRSLEMAAETNAAIQEAIDQTLSGGVPSQAVTDFLGRRLRDVSRLIDLRTEAAVRVARQRIEQLGPNVDRESMNVIAREELAEAMADARAAERGEWAKLPDSLQGQVASIRAKLGEIKGRQTKASDPEDFPSAIDRVVNGVIKKKGGKKVRVGGFKDTEDFAELQGLRSRLLAEKRKEAGKDVPNRRLLANLDELQETVLDAMRVGQPEEFRSAIDAAIAASRQFNDTFTRGPVGRLLGFDARGGEKTPALLTLERTLKQGPEGGVNATALLNAAGGRDRFVDAARSFLKEKFIQEVAPDGTVNANNARRFIGKHRTLLERFPGLRDEFSSVTNAQRLADTFESSGVRLKRNLHDQRQSAAALWLDQEPQKAIARVLASKNPAATMGQLIRQAGRDPSGMALQGLRQGFFEELLGRSLLGTRDVRGQRLVGKPAFDRFMRNPSIKRVMTQLYEPDQIRRVGEVAKALEMATRRPPPGVPTPESDPNINIIAQFMARIAGGTVGSKVGQAAGVTPLIAASAGATAAKKALSLMGKNPEKKAAQLIDAAILDPRIMADLLKTPKTAQQGDEVFQRLRGHLLNLGLTEDDDQ